MLCLSWGSLAAGAEPAGPPGDALVLDTSSFYRTFYVLSGPVVRKGAALDAVKVRAAWLMHATQDLPATWVTSEYDDSGWVRAPLFDPNSPYISRACFRGRFAVTDPQAARLKLSLAYHGGAKVYVNGAEVARGHVTPAGVAEDYARDDKDPKPRQIEGVAVPQALLRKGVNVIAIECVRAPLRESDIIIEARRFEIAHGFCGPVTLRLVAEGGVGAVPNILRPKGLQLWNSGPSVSDFDLDWGDPNEPLRPIRLVAPRGGVASGKVVVGSADAVKGLVAKASEVSQRGGLGRIPVSALELRYALASGDEHESTRRYTLAASRFDALDTVAPAEIPLAVKRPSHYSRKLSDEPAPVAGAICPVWVTVSVPADAAPGDYAGAISISVAGGKAVSVPVELTVSPWKCPPAKDFRTFVEIVQSPETTAMYYRVPLWSDRHFELIARSLDLLGEVGNKTCHLMLISDTNQGNDETMVRWIRNGGNTFRHDFSVLERYLDAVVRHQGKPEVVCLYVWDTYLDGGVGGAMQWAGDEVKKERTAHAGHGPLVTFLDPATGKAEKGELPSYLGPEGRAQWEPVIRGVLERLKARGLDKGAMLGIGTDNIPTKEVVAFFKQVAPGLPWISHSHPYRTDIEGVPTGYASGVWSGGVFPQDPSEGRSYGWRRKDLAVHFPRSTFDYWPMTTWRFEGEMNIAGNQRGFARFGGDFFGVLKDKRGYTRGSLSARFPKTSWRNLDIRSALLAAGQSGPVATARFEMIREGLQECEARIAIEEVLTDKARRARLGEALALQYQALLDERTRDMRRAVSTLRSEGAWTQHAQIDNTWWQAPGVLGSLWFASSGWQDKTAALYEAAAAAEKAR